LTKTTKKTDWELRKDRGVKREKRGSVSKQNSKRQIKKKKEPKFEGTWVKRGKKGV